MSLTQKDIEHIATLGRIAVSEKEKEIFSEQLSSILEYVAQLQEADTKDCEYHYQVDGLENVRAADEAQPCDPSIRENVLRAFPDRAMDLLKVKGVFEE